MKKAVPKVAKLCEREINEVLMEREEEMDMESDPFKEFIGG